MTHSVLEAVDRHLMRWKRIKRRLVCDRSKHDYRPFSDTGHLELCRRCNLLRVVDQPDPKRGK